MTSEKTTDKPPVKKSAVAKNTAEKTSGSNTKKESASPAATKPAATKDAVANAKANAKAATAATAKAGALNEADMKSAAKKISELEKKTANEAVKSRKSRDALKTRAHEAKLRAQEKILEKSFVSDPPEDPLERLANTFDSSAKRWEMVVYPSLFAFVLLAGYGFFLIYRLTHDIATLSQSVTHMAVIVSDSMPRMTKDLNVMTGSIDNMTGNIDGMTEEIVSMSGQMNSLTPMSKNIQSMTHNIGSMNRSVYGMQRDMHGMNRTVSSGPFGMMNDIMPFSSSTNVPPPIQPSPVWPSYNPVPYQRYPQARARPVQPARTVTPARLTAAKPEQNTIKSEVTMPGASPVSIKKPLDKNLITKGQ